MLDRLVVRFNDRLVGELFREEKERISLRYDKSWCDDYHEGKAFPISLSLPIISPEIKLDATTYVAGLLPDSPHHRETLIHELGLLDDDTDFALISRMGRDNAGALCIIPDGEVMPDIRPDVEWLTIPELAEHVRSLPRRPLLLDDEQGIVLSLAGVNDKAAVVVKNGRIGLPRNGYPSTHIIKIDIHGLEDSIKTEHFGLMLARSVGLRAPKARIYEAEDQTFMLMARYDRTFNGDNQPIRLHQEDFCQALGFHPKQKYERHGGPGWPEVFKIMSRCVNPTEARAELLRNFAFQFLFGNPDAHAKNYSVLYSGDAGSLYPAPIYDLNNAAAFRHKFKKTRPIMAMSIGDQMDRDAVTEDDFRLFAKRCGFRHEFVMKNIRVMAEQIVDKMERARELSSSCQAVDDAITDIMERSRSWAVGHDRRVEENISPI